jgi:Ribbon-helix-helix protein, copG family
MATASTSIRIDAEAAKTLKVIAAQEGVTVRWLVEMALYGYYETRFKMVSPSADELHPALTSARSG